MCTLPPRLPSHRVLLRRNQGMHPHNLTRGEVKLVYGVACTDERVHRRGSSVTMWSHPWTEFLGTENK